MIFEFRNFSAETTFRIKNFDKYLSEKFSENILNFLQYL